MNKLLIQLIGAVGYSLLAFSYFKEEKKSILFMQIIAFIFFSIHYYLLNAITGAICNLLGLFVITVIYLIEMKKNNIQKKYLVIGMIPILTIISLLTYENIYSIFPIIALICSLLSFLTDNENIIRKIGILSAIGWLIYAIIYKSYAAIIFEVFIVISTTIAFIKMNKKNSNKK